MENNNLKLSKENKKVKKSDNTRSSSFQSGKLKFIKLSKLKYEEKVVQVKRVTKVVKGGKKMTFRAVVIIGDNKKKVGVGIGRAEDVNLAIDKAILNGKKNLISVPLTIFSSIPHVIEASFGASKIMLRPASSGTGVIAGGSVRTVLELAGINNILNNAKVTILALIKLNEKIELGKFQSLRKKFFYDKIMKKYPNVSSSK